MSQFRVFWLAVALCFGVAPLFDHRAVSNRGPRRRQLTTTSAGGAAAVAIACAFLPGPADASLIITVNQVGADVVASTPGGPLDTSSLFLSAGGATVPLLASSIATLVSGTTPTVLVELYGGVSGPTSFGPGGTPTLASTGSGAGVGIDGFSGELYVPLGYVSGTPIAASTTTYSAATIASLGLTPGTYVYNWGSGGSADSLAVNIVPEPTTGALLALGILVLAARRHSKPETARRRLT